MTTATSPRGYFHIIVRPKRQYIAFHTQDVGSPCGIQRLTGHRPSGAWNPCTWLLSKSLAHDEKGKLVPDTREAAELLATLKGDPIWQYADVFEVRG